MKRREFIAGLGAVAWPLLASGQQPALPVIGFLNVGMRDESVLSAFRQGLREAGFVEGQNVAIEYRWAENQKDRLSEFTAELVQRRVAVIVDAPNSAGIAVAKAATATIPIVFLSGPDPVRIGLVASLNRPGGNLTGVTLLSTDLAAKRFGLLHDLAPHVATVAMVMDRRPQFDGTIQSENQDFNFKEAESAARSVGLRIIGVSVGGEGDFDAAFATAIRERADALFVAPSIFFTNNRDRFVALAARYRLPAIYAEGEYAKAGGLTSYGPSLTDAYRQLGVYTGRVLKGEKRADLPVMLPTKFELIINAKTAKNLGLTIPETLLATADEVIQ
jgi:putative ABC transport system substrate-binding protein